jgi:aconitate decarboxylase
VTKSGWPYRATGSATEAQMNLGYGIAVMLLEGDAFVDQYRDELLTDPRVLALIEKVSIVADEEFDALGEKHRHHVRVEVQLADGTSLSDERQFALGSFADPLSNDEVIEKFDKLVAGRPRPDRASAVKDMVLGLEDLDDVGPLATALAEA